MSLVHAARTRLRLLFAPRAAESRMDEEMRLHIDLETERLVREEGLQPREARRRALVAFGGVERYKEDMRDGRGLAWLGGFALDVKLAMRMMGKYPGLSLVSVVGMAVAIAVGAGAFTFLSALTDPTLPLREGERVVSLQNADARTSSNHDRQALADFVLWRERLTTVHELGAYADERRTLVLPDGGAELVKVARITASGFGVARVAPVLGRTLIEDDERAGAPPVLVIAYEEWQRRFGGDSAVIGRQVGFGSARHTIVGVMPPRFRFPVNHRFWVPLRVEPADPVPGAGPEIYVFGRLAAGATIEAAQAELAAIGPAGAATRKYLRPQLLPYVYPYVDLHTPGTVLFFHAIEVAVSLLLVIVAVNVSVLVYARTAARTGEIAVRTALGASRRRVIAQLFTEALVLSAIAATLGMTITRAGLAMVLSYQERTGRAADAPELPFWVNLELSPAVVLYVAGLTLLASVIVGVLPALKATGRDVQAGLQQLSARGSRMQLGRTWTTLIVAQVALAVAILPYAAYISGQALRRGTAAAAFPVEEILRAELTMERTEAPSAAAAAAHDSAIGAAFVRHAEELVRRLESEPSVVGVTFASYFPGEERFARIEVEGGETRNGRRSRVDAGMLGVLGVPIVAGRALAASDIHPVANRAAFSADEATAALVNRPLAEWMSATGPVLGRRVRLVRQTVEGEEERIEKGPWLDVVGVMPDFAVQADFEVADAKIYVPASLAGAASGSQSVSLVVRVRGTPAQTFARRFRQVAAAVDPSLQLQDLRTAADLQWEAQQALRMTGTAIAVVTLSVLLLSAAGIYAMMAFTVARRRREIGIRAALGADARRILGGIFARAGTQLGVGLAVGVVLAIALNQVVGEGVLTRGRMLTGERLLLLPLAAGLMALIGLLAAMGPARRGLAVQPIEVLREE